LLLAAVASDTGSTSLSVRGSHCAAVADREQVVARRPSASVGVVVADAVVAVVVVAVVLTHQRTHPYQKKSKGHRQPRVVSWTASSGVWSSWRSFCRRLPPVCAPDSTAAHATDGFLDGTHPARTARRWGCSLPTLISFGQSTQPSCVAIA